MILKILGGIDLAAALAFLFLIFGTKPLSVILVFLAVLLFVKGLFVFSGEILSVIDLFSAALLTISIFFNPLQALLWIPAFLLLAKGVVSFL